MTRPRVLVLLFIVYLVAIRFQSGVSSQAPPPKRPPEELLRLSLAAEKPGLAEPFKGITTNGQLEPGCSPSARPASRPSRSARRPRRSSPASRQTQRAKTMFAVDDPRVAQVDEPELLRAPGRQLPRDDAGAARGAPSACCAPSLSARGLKQTRDIMRLNETLGELTDNNFDEYGEWRYHITVMGTPSATEPWGWQFDGHHAIINYFVLGDQVVMTPFFAGSEPVIAPSGKYKGTAVLQDEQNRGLALINALDRRAAQEGDPQVLEDRQRQPDRSVEGQRRPRLRRHPRARSSPTAQRQQLLDLIALYVDNMDDGHARVKMDEVRSHLDRTWFAWIGGTDAGSVFYYRIHSPVILIEFDHQQPVGLRHLMDPSVPNRAAHPRRGPHAERQRLRQGPAAAALPAASASGAVTAHMTDPVGLESATVRVGPYDDRWSGLFDAAAGI